jgi:hypothetical protein
VVDDRPELYVVLEQEAAELEELIDVGNAPPVEAANDDPVEPAGPDRLQESLEVMPFGALVPLLFVLESELGGDADAGLVAEPDDVFALVFQLLFGGADPEIPGAPVGGLWAGRDRQWVRGHRVFSQ